MFGVAERDRARAQVLALAEEDPRVVAAAVVGSLADGAGDRWSDLDLTFGVADGVDLAGVLADWTGRIAAELRGAHLFDLPSGRTIYRVFLLPGCLQLDVSFTPASAFGPGGPRWRLLFGETVELPPPAGPPARELFGYAVHHARAARVALERGRRWQAEYWLSALRDHVLALACRRRGLPPRFARGFDDLPADVLAAAEPALARSLEPGELGRALAAAVETLLAEADEAAELAAEVAPQLRELAAFRG